MSVSSSDSGSLASIGANAGIPSLNVADIPADIRSGNKQAQQAYSEGLAFEQVLVNELTTQMANAMGSDSLDPTADSSDGSSTSSSGLLGGASSSAYASMIPSALTSSIMDGGGLGLAEEFAKTIDPALSDPTADSSSSTSSADAQTGSSGVNG
jgi:Rod binding domain-containing protein